MSVEAENYRHVLSRRRLLQAAGAAALTGQAALSAHIPARSAASGTPWRIDTHHHVVSRELYDRLVSEGIVPSDGPPFIPWSVDYAFEVMDANGIAAAVLSLPIPSAFVPDESSAAATARRANESLAELVRAHPTRFGFFAHLPLPHVDRALEELTYAFETLQADGVNLMAHAGDRYLGDPAFDPVFEELQRRKVVVFTHPFELVGGAPPGVWGFLADYMLDTTRAAIRMILAGTLDRYPDVKVILPHGGGFLPYMGSRLKLGTYLGESAGADTATVKAALRRFYYDTAMWTSPYATPSLLAGVDRKRVLYGTDFNALPAAAVAEARDALETDPLLLPPLRYEIERSNALRILPRLAARIAKAR